MLATGQYENGAELLARSLARASTATDFEMTVFSDHSIGVLARKDTAGGGSLKVTIRSINELTAPLDFYPSLQQSEYFLKLAMPVVLRGEGKLLCLDADVLLNAARSDAIAESLGSSQWLGIASDWFAPTFADRARQWNDDFALANEQVGCSPEASYGNSGVMIVDTEEWIKRDILGACNSIAGRFVHLLFPDQDVLNLATRGDFSLLDGRCNIPPILSFAESRIPGAWRLTSDLAATEWTRSIFVHYLAGRKPWLEGGAIDELSSACLEYPEIWRLVR